MIHVAIFAGIIVAANALTSTLGVVTWFGLTATAGTWVAGVAFIARDNLQELGGSRWIIGAILLGAAVSALLSPTLAVASAAAFMISELCDWAVYSPLRRRHPMVAAVTSNTVGSIVDTVTFLYLAGFPIEGAPTQVIVKVGTTAAVVMGVRLALSRQPLHAERGRRND